MIEFCSTSKQDFAYPLLALDIGKRRIGVAVSDALGLHAHGIQCLHRRDQGWPKQVLKIIREYYCKGVIIGLAKNMDGSEGEQAQDCRQAAAELAKVCDLPMAMQDERLTTWTAKERLFAQGLNEKKMRLKLDQTSAAVILEAWMSEHPRTKDGYAKHHLSTP